MNKFSLMASATLLAAGLTHTAQADTNFTINGNIELDTTATDPASSTADTTYDQGGRVEVNVTGEHTMGDYFVRGKGSAILKKNSAGDTDDMWFQFGSSAWDVQMGRYEAINLFPLGKDTVVVHVPGVTVYEANRGRGRIGGDDGQISLRIHPSDGFAFAVDTVYGDSTFGGDGQTLFSVIRPSVTFGAGGFTVTIGAESVDAENAGVTVADASGFAVTANFNAGGADINLNVATLDDKVANVETTTLGANAIIGPFGIGWIHSEDDTAGSGDPSLDSIYAAYTVPLFDIKRATLTYAIAHSTADDVGADDSTTAFRLRVNYSF